MAFAAGDAFGVAYEYLPDPIPVDELHLATRGDWPVGGVSDDTHLSLLTIFAADANDPGGSGEQFLHDLRSALPRLRGLGPTTKAALGLPPEPGPGFTLVGTPIIGNTNGGLMRTSLLGLGFTSAQDSSRRALVAEMARITHPADNAVNCSVLGSALYARALDTPTMPVKQALLQEAGAIPSLGQEISAWLDAIDTWVPSEAGVTLDPVDTLAAVTWVLGRTNSPLEGYRLACELGGDTDTVAALVGGIIAACHPDAGLLQVPWLDEVMWSEIPEVVAAATRLASMRTSA